MKKLIMVMCCASSVVFAESRVLPPVIDNSTYPAGSSSLGSTPSNHAIYEVLGRLEQLQLELQQLRGMVEEQSQTIIDLKKRQGNIYSDLDLRLQELSGVDISASKKPPEISPSEMNKPAVEMPENMAGIVANNKQKPVESTVATVEPHSTTSGAAESVTNESELYQTAYETLRNGHNARAISAFKSLLAKFPDGEYADNAQYWLGEAYKVNKEIDSAKAAFTKVMTQYPGSAKVPDAILKLAYIELEQNNMAKARDYLTQITVSHPGTTAAHLASKKLMSLDMAMP